MVRQEAVVATGSAVARVAIPTGATVAVTSVLAILVNLATGKAHSVWLWLAVAALTVVSFAASMWLHHRQTPPPTPLGSAAVGTVGVDLEDVHSAGLRVRDVRSAGTGVRVRGSRFRNDVDISGVDTGSGETPHDSLGLAAGYAPSAVPVNAASQFQHVRARDINISPNDLRGASNFILGDNGRQIFNWGDPRTRKWVIIGTALVLIAITISTILVMPGNPRAALTVDALEVADPKKINADVFVADGQEKVREGSEDIDANSIDISLNNGGNAAALITEVRAQIIFVEHMRDCAGRGAGPVELNGEYILPLPNPIPPTPFVVTRSLRYEVKGGEIQRLGVTIGPKVMNHSTNSTPKLIVARLAIVHGRERQELDVGTVAVVAESGAGEINAKSSTDLECVKDNAELIDRVFEIQAERSEEFTSIRRIYADLLKEK
ncbi:hypothetical protein ACTD5D_20885 [Nocardia takedensis]|uniref:hypothetical protein n=1 Tax=Nocardia takedensis TaxID=259390 RepID=UPI003F7688B0